MQRFALFCFPSKIGEVLCRRGVYSRGVNYGVEAAMVCFIDKLNKMKINNFVKNVLVNRVDSCAR